MLCWILGYWGKDAEQGVRLGKLTSPWCCPYQRVQLLSGNLVRSPPLSAKAVALKPQRTQISPGGISGLVSSSPPSLLWVHSIICSTTHWRSCTLCLAFTHLLWKRWLQKEQLTGLVCFRLLKDDQVKMPLTSGQRQKKCKHSCYRQAWIYCWYSHCTQISSQVGRAFHENVCTALPSSSWPVQLLFFLNSQITFKTWGLVWGKRKMIFDFKLLIVPQFYSVYETA